VIRASSLTMDMILLLLQPNTSVIGASNDNGGGGTNALISISAAQAGGEPGFGTTVWVIATSKGTRGNYTLSLDPAP
jgi:hypothetical protein